MKEDPRGKMGGGKWKRKFSFNEVYNLLMNPMGRGGKPSKGKHRGCGYGTWKAWYIKKSDKKGKEVLGCRRGR